MVEDDVMSTRTRTARECDSGSPVSREAGGGKTEIGDNQNARVVVFSSPSSLASSNPEAPETHTSGVPASVSLAASMSSAVASTAGAPAVPTSLSKSLSESVSNFCFRRRFQRLDVLRGFLDLPGDGVVLRHYLADGSADVVAVVWLRHCLVDHVLYRPPR